MSKKDYQMLADVITQTEWRDEAQKLQMIANLSNHLSLDNARFDRSKFAEACGVKN